MQWLLRVPDDLADVGFRQSLEEFLGTWLSDGFYSLTPFEDDEHDPA